MLLLLIFPWLIHAASNQLATQETTLQLSATSNISELMLPSNESNTALNVTAVNAKKMYVECDGASYGTALNVDDCDDAKGYIPFNPKVYWFAQRHSRYFTKKDMFPLPYRMMGST